MHTIINAGIIAVALLWGEGDFVTTIGRSVASTTSLAMPRLRATTLAEPPGRTAIGIAVPASPLATSFSVPSPPKATTTSWSPLLAASRLSSVAWFCAWVETASTSKRPCNA